jgi:biopolymer transport protein ExbD
MLLIIFFVSNLKFPKEEGTLSANLPKGSIITPSDKPPPKIDKIVIGMDAVGTDGAGNQQVRIIVNNQPLNGVRALDTKLFSLNRQIPDAEITLDVKPTVQYDNVVQVFNYCAKNHFTKIAFAQPAAGP